MDEVELKTQLEKEGFKNVFLWRDAPGTFYPEHTHSGVSAHIVLEGEMELEIDGVKHSLKAGDRFDVSDGEVHSARMGPKGCVYLVGGKY